MIEIEAGVVDGCWGLRIEEDVGCMVVVLVVIVLLVGAVWGQQETVALHLAIAVVSSVSIGRRSFK
jgi:hypothetical protein